MLIPPEVRSDPKPRARIKDSLVLRTLHLEWRECALCGKTGQLSLHHINKHPRDDVRGNLVMVCGSGTTGCHGRIEAHDQQTMWLLGEHIMGCRGDTIVYLYEYLGAVAAQDWIRRNLLVEGVVSS